MTHWTAADYWGKQTHRDTVREKNTTTGFSHENLSVFTSKLKFKNQNRREILSKSK